MHATPLLVVVLCVLALAFRFYSRFIARKVLVLDDKRVTPAHQFRDGHNYHPTPRWVLFGHHFAAISGAGPLIGPVLAAQFGYLPGLLWLLVGVVLAGAVQDFIILVASVRRRGKSLAQIVLEEIGPVAGFAAGVAILFVLIIALAGLGIVVVSALAESAWGAFTIALTIPIALLMGIYTYKIRIGKVGEATLFGVIALFAAVIGGRFIVGSPFEQFFLLSKNQLTVILAGYGFVASVLPVWLLLCPRDYLSSFMKIGTIALLVCGVLLVNPELKIPAISEFVHGGGPILPGKVFPFVFITIMCGAVSGFHALVSSGTTPKMVSKESDCRIIGYGSMLMEGLVGIVALLAVSTLSPGDYFAMNVTEAKFADMQKLGYHLDELPVLEAQVEEKVRGRVGGAVSLAVGMAKVFSSIPFFKGLMAYWYHFAIMFEALFILTTIDTGTRIARFVFQEFLGKVIPIFSKTDWVPGTVLTSLLTVFGWGYFIWTGSISTIWPMFGIANQLLAAIALCVGTTVLANMGKRKYLAVTLLPMCFVVFTTTCGAVELVRTQFWEWATSAEAALKFRGYLDISLTVVMLLCLLVVLFSAVPQWWGRTVKSSL